MEAKRAQTDNSYLGDDGFMNDTSEARQGPNHALQRTGPSRHCCDLSVPRAGSLSLGRALPSVLIAVFLLAHTERDAFAFSGSIQLTTTNIQTSYSFIAVKPQDGEADTKRFRVIIVPRQGIEPGNFYGSLRVYDGTRLVASCVVPSTKLPSKSKDVDERVRDKAVVFEFVVGRDYLAASKFSVIDQPPDVPSFMSYWFYLRDFADAK